MSIHADHHVHDRYVLDRELAVQTAWRQLRHAIAAQERRKAIADARAAVEALPVPAASDDDALWDYRDAALTALDALDV